MSGRPTFQEMKDRIQTELHHFGGTLPERVALVWDGYLAALIEWGLLTPSEHKELSNMLPSIPDNPVIEILLGRESARSSA